MCANKLEKKLLKEIKDRNITQGELNAVVDQIKNPNLEVLTHRHYWSNKHTKIGLCSDTHVGSKYTKYDILEDIFKRFKKDKVDAIYISGDITEGYNMRPGHTFECDLHGADAQIQGVLERIPDIKIPIYFITGDHDYSHYKRQGIDIGKHIDTGRKDMHYLGMFDADVKLTKNTSLRLTHPAKGTSYAISYQPQKMIEALSGGEKPNILQIGHYHKMEYLFYRNIHAIQSGCIQSQSAWMKRMNIAAMTGAWIADVYTKRNGEIDNLELKILPYYK